MTQRIALDALLVHLVTVCAEAAARTGNARKAIVFERDDAIAGQALVRCVELAAIANGANVTQLCAAVLARGARTPAAGGRVN